MPVRNAAPKHTCGGTRAGTHTCGRRAVNFSLIGGAGQPERGPPERGPPERGPPEQARGRCPRAALKRSYTIP